MILMLSQIGVQKPNNQRTDVRIHLPPHPFRGGNRSATTSSVWSGSPGFDFLAFAYQLEGPAILRSSRTCAPKADRPAPVRDNHLIWRASLRFEDAALPEET